MGQEALRPNLPLPHFNLTKCKVMFDKVLNVLIFHIQFGKKFLHQPRIEPWSVPWQSTILPLELPQFEVTPVCLQHEETSFIGEDLIDYTKLIANTLNVGVEVSVEGGAMLLLKSLPSSYQ